MHLQINSSTNLSRQSIPTRLQYNDKNQPIKKILMNLKLNQY